MKAKEKMIIVPTKVAIYKQIAEDKSKNAPKNRCESFSCLLFCLTLLISYPITHLLFPILLVDGTIH